MCGDAGLCCISTCTLFVYLLKLFLANLTPAVMLFCGHREVAMAVGVLLASATLQGCEDTQYATGEEAVEAICGNMRCLDYCRGCVLSFSGNGTEEELLKHSHLYSCGYPEKPENPCKVWDTWS